jgi:hypothetical protein
MYNTQGCCVATWVVGLMSYARLIQYKDNQQINSKLKV